MKKINWKVAVLTAGGIAAAAIAVVLNTAQVNVTYHLNGGQMAANSEEKVHLFSTVSTDEPARTAYDFDGWHLDENCTIALDSDYQVTGDTDIYAKWNKHRYQIKLHNVGETTDDNTNKLSKTDTVRVSSYSLGEGADLPTMSRKGQDFLGWASITNEDDGTTGVTVETAITSALLDSNGLYIDADKDDTNSIASSCIKGVSLTQCGNLDLYPVFKNSVYSLTYDLNGGACDTLSDSYTYGDTVEFENPVRDGYTFCGWYFDEDCEDEAKITASTTGDKTLYAAWQKNVVKQQTYQQSYSNSYTNNNTASNVAAVQSEVEQPVQQVVQQSVKLNITSWFYTTYDTWGASESRVGVYGGTADPYDNRPAYLVAHLGLYYGNIIATLNEGDLITFNGATYRVSYRMYTNQNTDSACMNALSECDYGYGNHIYFQTCADYQHVGNDWLVRAELVS